MYTILFKHNIKTVYLIFYLYFVQRLILVTNLNFK